VSTAINLFYKNISEGFKYCPVPPEHVSKLEQILDGFIYHGLEVLFRDALAGYILPREIDFMDSFEEDEDGEEDDDSSSLDNLRQENESNEI